MRNLALRLVLWLCDRFAIHLIDETRIRHGADAVERGQRWEQFAREDGGLYDMIDTLRRDAFEAAAEVPPEDVEKLQYFAMSDRNLRRLKGKVDAVIANGKIEADKRRQIDRQNVARLRR